MPRATTVADEYIFKLNKTTTITKYWKCTLDQCLVKVHTNLNDQVIKMIDDHSHLPETEKLEVREKVKQRAINETTPISRIYYEECAKVMLSIAAIVALPSEHKMSKQILFLYV